MGFQPMLAPPDLRRMCVSRMARSENACNHMTRKFLRELFEITDSEAMGAQFRKAFTMLRIVILGMWLIGLIPWFWFAALSFMAFGVGCAVIDETELLSNLWPGDVNVEGHVVVTGIDLGFAARRRQTPHCTSRGDGAVRIDNRNRIHKPVAAEAIAPQGVALNLNLAGFVITAE